MNFGRYWKDMTGVSFIWKKETRYVIMYCRRQANGFGIYSFLLSIPLCDQNCCSGGYQFNKSACFVTNVLTVLASILKRFYRNLGNFFYSQCHTYNNHTILRCILLKNKWMEMKIEFNYQVPQYYEVESIFFWRACLQIAPTPNKQVLSTHHKPQKPDTKC